MSEVADTPRWVYIERDYYYERFGVHLKDVYIGPFEGPKADENAARCMQEALLVEDLLQPAGGGGYDCFVTTDQPDKDKDDIYIIDHDDPHQTGKES